MMFLHVFVILSPEMSVFQHAPECGQGCIWMRDVHGSVDGVWTGAVWKDGMCVWTGGAHRSTGHTPPLKMTTEGCCAHPTGMYSC